jgi:hypothetical protein
VFLVKLRYRLRKRQVKVLEKFARTMKWPNIDETLDRLRQRNADANVDAVSSDAMAFFSGLVLPGVGSLLSIIPFPEARKTHTHELRDSRRTPS